MAPKSSKGKRSAQKGRNSSSYQMSRSGLAATEGNRAVMGAFRRTPTVYQTSGGGLRVCNTERVISATSFVDNTVSAVRTAFNPCNTSIFGWLPQIARNYSQYVVHGLKYSWVPRCATTNLCELQLGIFYDYGDASYYVSTLSGGTQLDNLSEFAFGTAWQGGPLATHDNKLLNVPTGWFGVVADTNKIHARVQRFTCNNTGGGTTPGENQVCAAHLVTRTFTPLGAALGAGQIYVSYDIEFFHPNIAAANAAPFTFYGLDSDPSRDKTCWKEKPDGTWEKVPCSPPPADPLPAPPPVDDPVDREVEARSSMEV